MMKLILSSSAAATNLLRRTASLPRHEKTIMNVVTWILLALVICTLAARFTVKLSRRTTRKLLNVDDIFLLLAAVSYVKSETLSTMADKDQLFSFGQTMAVSIQWRDVANQELMDLSMNKRAVHQKV